MRTGSVDSVNGPVCLALECSTTQASLSIQSATASLYDQSWHRISSHGEWILPAIEHALEFCQLKLEQVDLFAVGLGPGSFTGIRVAINAMKSLAYTQKKPIVGIDSLQLLALETEKFPSKLPICSALDSQDNRMLIALYERTTQGLKTKMEPTSIDPSDLSKFLRGPHLFAGNARGLTQNKNLRTPKWLPQYPNASTLAHRSIFLFHTDQTKAWNQIEPVYVRASSAEEKMRKGKSEA